MASAFLNKLAALSSFFGKTLALWVIAFALISFYAPEYFKWLVSYVSILLGVVMFGMGLTLRAKDFSEVFTRPIQVVIGIVGQFLIMPLIAFGLVTIFKAMGAAITPEIAAGVLLVGCCPGGTSSNVMSYLAKGDVPLSVTITACTTIMAPFVTPALFWLFASQWVEVDPLSMFISILEIVIIPIVAGVVVNTLFREQVYKVVVALPLVSVWAIIAIVTAVVSNSQAKIAETGLLIFAVVMLHNCLGYLLGYGFAVLFKMKLKQKKTISIEVGMQNSGLAVALANVAFSPAAAVPGAVFSVWHNISGPIVATIFRAMDKKEADKDTQKVSGVKIA